MNSRNIRIVISAVALAAFALPVLAGQPAKIEF